MNGLQNNAALRDRQAEKATEKSEATMNSRDIDVLASIAREHQDEIRREIKTEALLRGSKQGVTGMKRRLLLLLFGAIVVVVAAATGAQLFT